MIINAHYKILEVSIFEFHIKLNLYHFHYLPPKKKITLKLTLTFIEIQPLTKEHVYDTRGDQNYHE